MHEEFKYENKIIIREYSRNEILQFNYYVAMESSKLSLHNIVHSTYLQYFSKRSVPRTHNYEPSQHDLKPHMYIQT